MKRNNIKKTYIIIYDEASEMYNVIEKTERPWLGEVKVECKVKYIGFETVDYAVQWLRSGGIKKSSIIIPTGCTM